MERKVSGLIETAKQAEVTVKPWDYSYKTGPFGRGDNLVVWLEELEGHLIQCEERVLQMSSNEESLDSRLGELIQQHDVIAATSEFLTNVQQEEHTLSVLATNQRRRGGQEGDSSADTVLDIEQGQFKPASDSQGVGFVCGVIERKRLAAFQRVLWRALRGNVITRADEIPQREDELEPKSAFVAFVHGTETLTRVRKICTALGCTVYPLEASAEKRHSLYLETAARIDDVEAILYNTRQAKKAELVKLADVLEMWHVAILRQKHTYAMLNKFSCDSEVSSRRCFIAEGWCPTSSVGVIESSLKEACTEAGLNIAPVLTVLEPTVTMTPPTYFPTNKFTNAFQEMTDAYGVACYREINPAVPMIITFPFLFAVMFGDVGHGLIMAAMAGWMVAAESKLRLEPNNEAWNMAFSGRYVIFLMGLFSIFCGLVYNDFFSKALPLFPSMFYYPEGETVSKRVSPYYVYPLGLDPKWMHADNGMTYSNSYKMKQSILFGLVQMIFGLFLSLANMIHFGEIIDIWCIFLPQFLFMTCLFGYLGLVIILKWVTGADVSLLNLFIGMVLRFGAVEGAALYPGQQIVQVCLMVIVIACVPWMLLAKPVYIYLEKRTLKSQGYNEPDHGDGPARSSSESISSTARKVAASSEDHSIGDLVVHQVIHTIEFVLGSVSNTASYLRLWALSLAHAQLSDVLWDMTLGASMGSMIMLPIAFAVWACFTLGIMVAMEGMSAFLHALRLHWVEFNGKFYRGTGVKFEPFALRPDLLLTFETE